MRPRVLLSTVFALLTAGVLAVGVAIPASAAAVPLVHDETGLLTGAEVTQLQQVLTQRNQQYGVHLSVTMLKSLPKGQSLKAVARAAAQRIPLSAQARASQIAFLYVRHGGLEYAALGREAAKRLPQSQVKDIWGSQIHPRFHRLAYYQGLRKGLTLLGASYVGYSNAAFTEPAPSAAQRQVLNERGWFGVRIALALILVVVVASAVLSILSRRRTRRKQPVGTDS